MLVLVSFVLVLAAAVTLVVGLLQSGLTLIYLSIACSVLAGIVLAVAVLRGRPEPKAAPVGRPYQAPASAPPPPVPASVGAPAAAETTTSWSPPPSQPPPPPPSGPAPERTDDAATAAAGSALLGRLRGRRGGGDEPAAPAAVVAPEPAADPYPPTQPESMTTEMPVVSAETDEGFPIADYDQLRATDLLRRLGSLDRNQLEAVREREEAGKNRFTIMSRIDTLLAGMAEPAWDASDDEWDDADNQVEEDVDNQVEAETTIIEVGPVDDAWDDEDQAEELDVVAAGEMEDDEVDELVSPADDFPIAGYESLTVGQILPRLSELDADQLAQVRAREQEGRGRGTILDRIDRLASKSGAMAMPAPAARTRRAPARKAPATPVPAPPAAKVPAVRKARVAKVTPVAVEPMPAAAEPAAAPTKRAPRKSTPRKAAATEAPMVDAVKKATTRKSAGARKAPLAMPPAEAIFEPTPAKKAPGRRKAAAPPVADTPMKAAVKKARATKKQP